MPATDVANGDKPFLGGPAVWTAIFTGILTIFTALLWRVSDKANQTSVATQRAFISYSGPVLVKDIEDKKFKGVNVYYGMSNSGTTPANDTVFEWNLSLGETIADKGTNFDNLPQNERGAYVVGPKAAYQFKPVYLSMADLESVSEGRAHLFFWGWTTYRDIFEGTPKRLSEFCTEITNVTWTASDHTNPDTNLNTVTPPCPTHNCYDEGCEDYQRRIE